MSPFGIAFLFGGSMHSLILFISSFVVLFLIYLIVFYIIGLKKKRILKSMQVEFLKKRFVFNDKDFNPKKIGLIICIIDPLIISLTGTIVTMPKWNYIYELLIGFVVLLGLIFSFYEIIGRIKKRVMKNEL